MQDQPSRPLEELLRDVWGHMDEMLNLQSSTKIGVGVNLGRPKDNLDDLGKFSLMLADVQIDAKYSDAHVIVLEVENGYLLSTLNLAYAKRMVGALIGRGYLNRESDVQLINESPGTTRKEIALPSFEMN